MKEDSILLAFGSGAAINLDDLAAFAPKLRGILLDAHFNPPIPTDHPLFEEPNVLITFESGEYPKEKGDAAFRLFTANLRQFEHGNYTDMKNLVTI
jgi:phosphoglycerate dehydrogenase-like enzyme